MRFWKQSNYTREIHRNLGYLSVWPPLEKVQVGAVGRFEDGKFTNLTTLNQLTGSDYGVLLDRSKSETLSVHKDVSVKLSARSELSGACAQVELSSRNSVLFIAEGSAHQRLDAFREVEEEIIALDRDAKWRTGDVIITAVVRVSRISALVGKSGSARVEMAARPGIETAGLELIDVGGEISVQSGMVSKYSRIGDSTPLFQAHSLRRPLTRGAFLRSVRGFDADGSARSGSLLRELEPRDLL